MGESAKALCSLVLIVGTIAAAFVWFDDRPNAIAWGFRIGAPIVAALALALLLKLHFRVDVARDYLRDCTGTYFNREGFNFAFVATARDRVAYLVAYFQNQRDQPCIGRVVLRPARGFFLTRTDFEPIACEIACEPAAFGYVRLAIPIPVNLQGKRQTFEVGASAQFPDGKGQRLRFFDGVFLRTNTDFGSSFHSALAIVGVAAGTIVLTKPATVTIELPAGVAPELPEDVPHEIVTLWRLGDPPLARVTSGKP